MIMINCLKKVDLISSIPSARISFGKPSNHKTIMGGICTLMALVGFFLVAIIQGYIIFSNS